MWCLYDCLSKINRSQTTQSYNIFLEDENKQTRVFAFTVEEGDIQSVAWQDDFAEYLEQNLAPAAPLFEAILTFHRAHRLRLPSRADVPSDWA
jgi:hypothetical protein